MRKYLNLIFKGLGILSLVIAVGIIVTLFFFGELPTTEEKLDRCESHYCISIEPKGSEKFKDCVSDCMETMGKIYSGGFLVFALILVPVGIIFFFLLGVILLVISLAFREEDHSADHTTS